MDLPEPDSPTRAVTVPRLSWSETSSTAWTLRRLRANRSRAVRRRGKRLVTPRASSTTSVPVRTVSD
ncbi:hypothetical protein SMICM304S_09834 [Streptomyces microflavus]